ILGTSSSPAETDPVLVIDPNAVQPMPVPLEGFESIPRRHLQILQDLSLINGIQLPRGHPPKLFREPLTDCFGILSVEQVFRCRVLEAITTEGIAWTSCYGNKGSDAAHNTQRMNVA